MVDARAADRGAESFRGLLLRDRARTGLTQRQLALILVLLGEGGLTVGLEAAEAHELWAAVLRAAPRMHTPFDEAWFRERLAAHLAPDSTDGRPDVLPAARAAGPAAVEAGER